MAVVLATGHTYRVTRSFTDGEWVWTWWQSAWVVAWELKTNRNTECTKKTTNVAMACPTQELTCQVSFFDRTDSSVRCAIGSIQWSGKRTDNASWCIKNFKFKLIGNTYQTTLPWCRQVAKQHCFAGYCNVFARCDLKTMGRRLALFFSRVQLEFSGINTDFPDHVSDW